MTREVPAYAAAMNNVKGDRGPVGLQIDESDDFGSRAARHLRDDLVVWLTTVGRDGAPTPNPVWFLWDGQGAVRAFSLPDAARIRHLRANPRVSLNFPGDGRGGDIVVLSGVAAMQPDGPQADGVPEYVGKYAAQMSRIGLTPASFAARYTIPITITLTRLRGH